MSGFLLAALSLETPLPASPSSSSPSQQQQHQPRLKTLAEVLEERRRGEVWDEIGSGSGSGIPTRNGKGIKEEKRDDERVWQERVEGASRRAEEMQEERAAAPMAVGGGKGKKKDGYGDWSGRRERGRKGVMAGTILEESSSEVGF